MNRKIIRKNLISQGGITLIALVVTIIVLLILTAVTITLITGDESVILQAKASKQKQQESSDIEAIKVAVSAQNMKSAIAGGRTAEYFSAIEEELEDRYYSATATDAPDNANNLKVIVKDAVDSEEREYRVLEDGSIIVWENGNATTSPTSAPTQTIVPTPTQTSTPTPTPTPTTQVTLALNGAGTQSSPYLIYDADDLAYLAQIVNAGDSCTGEYFVLMNDINLSGVTWTPIGTYDCMFNGVFEGQGFRISNISDFSVLSYVALFGFTGGNSIIKNLSVYGTNISEIVSLRAAGIVGWNEGAIENCMVENATIKCFDDPGGIVGYNNTTGSINNCTVTGIAISGNRSVGGLVGRNLGIILNSTFDSYQLTADSDEEKGAFAGTNNGTIENCTNNTAYQLVGSGTGTIDGVTHSNDS